MNYGTTFYVPSAKLGFVSFENKHMLNLVYRYLRIFQDLILKSMRELWRYLLTYWLWQDFDTCPNWQRLLYRWMNRSYNIIYGFAILGIRESEVRFYLVTMKWFRGTASVGQFVSPSIAFDLHIGLPNNWKHLDGLFQPTAGASAFWIWIVYDL